MNAILPWFISFTQHTAHSTQHTRSYSLSSLCYCEIIRFSLRLFILIVYLLFLHRHEANDAWRFFIKEKNKKRLYSFEWFSFNASSQLVLHIKANEERKNQKPACHFLIQNYRCSYSLFFLIKIEKKNIVNAFCSVESNSFTHAFIRFTIEFSEIAVSLLSYYELD